MRGWSWLTHYDRAPRLRGRVIEDDDEDDDDELPIFNYNNNNYKLNNNNLNKLNKLNDYDLNTYGRQDASGWQSDTSSDYSIESFESFGKKPKKKIIHNNKNKFNRIYDNEIRLPPKMDCRKKFQPQKEFSNYHFGRDFRKWINNCSTDDDNSDIFELPQRTTGRERRDFRNEYRSRSCPVGRSGEEYPRRQLRMYDHHNLFSLNEMDRINSSEADETIATEPAKEFTRAVINVARRELDLQNRGINKDVKFVRNSSPRSFYYADRSTIKKYPQNFLDELIIRRTSSDGDCTMDRENEIMKNDISRKNLKRMKINNAKKISKKSEEPNSILRSLIDTVVNSLKNKINDNNKMESQNKKKYSKRTIIEPNMFPSRIDLPTFRPIDKRSPEHEIQNKIWMNQLIRERMAENYKKLNESVCTPYEHVSAVQFKDIPKVSSGIVKHLKNEKNEKNDNGDGHVVYLRPDVKSVSPDPSSISDFRKLDVKEMTPNGSQAYLRVYTPTTTSTVRVNNKNNNSSFLSDGIPSRASSPSNHQQSKSVRWNCPDGQNNNISQYDGQFGKEMNFEQKEDEGSSPKSFSGQKKSATLKITKLECVPCGELTMVTLEVIWKIPSFLFLRNLAKSGQLPGESSTSVFSPVFGSVFTKSNPSSIDSVQEQHHLQFRLRCNPYGTSLQTKSQDPKLNRQRISQPWKSITSGGDIGIYLECLNCRSEGFKNKNNENDKWGPAKLSLCLVQLNGDLERADYTIVPAANVDNTFGPLAKGVAYGFPRFLSVTKETDLKRLIDLMDENLIVRVTCESVISNT